MINNSAFGKTMENVRQQRDTKLKTTTTTKKYSVSEPNCRTTTRFSEKLFAI